jgi:hypothetical protein
MDEELREMNGDEDKRPAPKPRKRPNSWQAYLWWRELMEMRQRHVLRISSIERGKSNLDAQFEKSMMENARLDELLDHARAIMVGTCEAEFGEVWPWVTSIKGLGAGGLAAQLLAQIDDVALCPTVSSLWRFAGLAVRDGKAEKNTKGEKAHFNALLKGVCYNIAVSFIKAQTPEYVDIYYDEKRRQRQLHPEPEKVNGTKVFTDGHIHNRAWRKMVKIFLQHLWVTWRKAEGLLVSEPYVQAIMGHAKIREVLGYDLREE